MNPEAGLPAQLRDLLASDPLLTIAFIAAAIAYATTPLAFLALGRLNYLKTRRGRSFQPPSLASVVVSMMLVMGIPAIFCALVLKSRWFDRNRYEFDPNRSWSVLEQGRGYADLLAADQALKKERDLLDTERRALGNSLKEFDKAILDTVNEMGGASPKMVAVVRKLEAQLGPAHKWASVDAPHQLLDLNATPVEMLIAKNAMVVPVAGLAGAPGTLPATASNGLSKAQLDAELAGVPAPQKALAALLPLSDVPAGWSIGKMADHHLETFNAENLYEKINGRAESFALFDVKGMAYTFYHPTGDDSNEVQLYVFEMGNSLKALGKYGSEKPEEDATPVAVGKEGYTSAGSTLFYLDKYYIQIVSTKDSPQFAEFALAIGRKIEAAIDPALAATRAPLASSTPTPAPSAKAKVGPEDLFALLPREPKRSDPKYAAADVFGYAFLSDVFIADYSDGGASWQGFVRTCATPEEAKAMLEKYEKSAKENGAEVRKVEAEGADAMFIASNFGLVDIVFVKGNALAGSNGAPNAAAVEPFTRAFAKALPEKSPFIQPE